MKLTTKALAAACLLSFATPAFAADGGLFLEPAVTYETSTAKIDYPAPGVNSSGSLNGFGLGLRVGGHVWDTLFIAGDIRYSRPTYKDSNSSGDMAATSINYAPVVGVQTPLLGIRVWGAYVLGGELTPEESNGFQVKFSDPKGYRVGAGIRFLMVSANLEYQSLKYDKTSLEKAGPFAPGTNLDSKLQNDSYIVSVSFPLAM